MEQLNEVEAAFRCGGIYLGDEPYDSGHINDTYKAYYNVDGEVGGIDLQVLGIGSDGHDAGLDPSASPRNQGFHR